ncbi:trimeric porin PorB [Uruburuella testudinis]|uniref:Trimeric porin PorB n=1 Tax=Uruburuella testudinis TaxID=1282863 RepID=A0ABY4DUD0_9NEIS|nr:trimeric porin PorB [Uruburuella testudinis]UOO82466.1 trimeric porin PorB [Uruburuella testudinis]
MKKTLIALTLAALPVAASADVILYGQIKAGVEVSQVKIGDDKSKTATEIADFGSRIGFKGHEHLGNNLNAIWQVENNVNVAGGGSWAGRESFIGLEGGFGKIRAGKLETQLKNMDAIDPWEYSNNALGLGVFTRTGERVTSVRYDTPVWAGFSGNVQYTPRDNANPTDKYTHEDPSRDAYYAGLNYENAGWFAQYGFGFKNNNYVSGTNGETKDGYAHQLQAGYDANNLFVALGAQYTSGWDTLGSYADALSNGAYGYVPAGTVVDGDVTPWSADDNGIKTIEAAATAAYRFGNITPRISYAHGFKPKMAGEKLDLEYNQVVIGADYDFSKRTSALVSAGWLKAGKGDSKVQNTAGMVGLRHKF